MIRKYLTASLGDASGQVLGFARQPANTSPQRAFSAGNEHFGQTLTGAMMYQRPWQNCDGLIDATVTPE